MKLSVITLGDHLGERTQQQRYADIITQGVWAEELGFDGFHIGEHHFCDYIVSNPVPLLTAVAMKTERIRLSTAVTLLANRDPVLVAEDYAALDLISGGRAELVVGRGNLFTECYRQFGQDMDAARAMFEENLDLLLVLWSEAPVSSPGLTRPPLDRARTQPRPLQKPHPMIWVGGGSSPESAQSAAKRGLGFQMPGVFTGAPFFRPLADLYRSAFRAGALGEGAKGVGYTAHCFVGEDGAAARTHWAPYYTRYLDWVRHIAAAPGAPPVGSPPDFERQTGALKTRVGLCGSPKEIRAHIEEWRETLGGLDALLLMFDGGGADAGRAAVDGAVCVRSRAGAARLRRSAMSEPILQSTSEGVLTITLNRPEALNALNRPLMEAFRAALAAAAHDDGVRALIVTGAGRGFCAGADLTEGATSRPASRGQGISDGMTSHFNPLARDIAQFPKPTIAAVNGTAAGGGVGIALACDIVVAAKSAKFIQVFAPQLGLVPDMGCSWHLPRLVGAARARGLALLGDRLSAEDAEKWGLIWQCVDDAELATRASEIASKLAAGPTKGLVATRRVLDAALDNDLVAQLDLERRVQHDLGNTNDFAEGVAAFIQKRKPNFTGS